VQHAMQGIDVKRSGHYEYNSVHAAAPGLSARNKRAVLQYLTAIYDASAQADKGVIARVLLPTLDQALWMQAVLRRGALVQVAGSEEFERLVAPGSGLLLIGPGSVLGPYVL
jgi:predicted LPLAT superfamily acyltransferase